VLKNLRTRGDPLASLGDYLGMVAVEKRFPEA
jgi:hypothetical protein